MVRMGKGNGSILSVVTATGLVDVGEIRGIVVIKTDVSLMAFETNRPELTLYESLLNVIVVS